MAITGAQIAAAETAANKLASDIQQMQVLLNYINSLYSNNWSFTVDFLGTTYPINSTDQANLLAQYSTLKNQMATDYASLP